MKNKNLIAVIAYDISQLLLLGIFIYYNFIIGREKFTPDVEYQMNMALGTLIIVLSILGIYMNRRIFEVFKLEKEYEIQQINLKNIHALNNLQRSQRHDFLNHLHVIHHLAESEETKALKNYVERIYQEVYDANIKVNTGLIEVDALLQSKLSMAKIKGIAIEMINEANLKDIKVEPWKLISILGNIIDNAIDACMEGNTDNRNITVELRETKFKYLFSIKNTGPLISHDNLEKIFSTGFTTKGDRGQGLGLSICKKYVEEHDGKIEVKSNRDETIFTIEFYRF
ncbi:MAG: signal transduction histidine kinase regulating citrate/malate metabolism [Anaerosolibacter sp.]|uniref:sensor histidine kinase n=1 Tax=Anaerosolibacter sp. TaxID=1872527 RepID=UPI00261FFC49|nr:ATP-binding protein [Anaerosolibacter sp.]MDF2547100.1 signal transduction histidine kinase regulating citrate/malate metabolism [Anaerosolibacter sp.]